MLIILPPSETKAAGGSGPSLSLAQLSFPSLNPIRETLISKLESLDIEQAMGILKLGPKSRSEAEANYELRTAPTSPALLRYTGVLFDALDAPSLPAASWNRLAIGSALFGLLMAKDPIPKYRLSGNSKLDGTLKSHWGNTITEVLDDQQQLVLDLRSGAYLQLGPHKEAITLRVENPDGKVISHFNKHYKGLLARELSQVPDELLTIEDIVEASNMNLTITSPTSLTMVVDQT
ncbi:YaaA family protein [Corynebacterium freiburgense]|uniref:YaaA family protein n=1 Tax=Corynebacterium freiburgense TaxID=556548 RepID=UPI00047B64B0|nr:peroxide stress protein YaaA [Corynebacterium freiburgense]WJZ02980.1 hypothetical protein CFREI_08510 [Corynebacterium freiburgense]